MIRKEEWHTNFVETEGHEPLFTDYEMALLNNEIELGTPKFSISAMWYIAEGAIAAHAAATLYLAVNSHFLREKYVIIVGFGIFILFGAWAVHYFYKQWLAGILLMVGNILTATVQAVHWFVPIHIAISWVNISSALAAIILIWFKKYSKSKKI